MNVTRITGLLILTASIALSACSGGGAPTTTNEAEAPTSSADAYTGPAAATADVQAFQVNFWANVRVQIAAVNVTTRPARLKCRILRAATM